MNLLKKIGNRVYKSTHPEIGEVWQFHHVCSQDELVRLGNWAVSTQRIINLISDYKRERFSFISMDELSKRIKWNAKGLREKFVAITLDDGFVDNLDCAFPVFEENAIPFCIYVCPGGVIEGDGNVYLSRGQLKDLSCSDLCTIGAHTMSHAHLIHLPFEKQREEILNSKLWLEDAIGKPVKHFAYPYGEYNSDTLKIMGDLGFDDAVAGWGGSVRKGCDRYRVPRYVIWENVKYKHL